MKTALLVAAAVLAASPAWAGANHCTGPVVDQHDGWTFVMDFGEHYSRLCQFETTSRLGKRILRICPHGSTCTLKLSGDKYYRDHLDEPTGSIIDGIMTTIIDWPADGGVIRNGRP